MDSRGSAGPLVLPLHPKSGGAAGKPAAPRGPTDRLQRLPRGRAPSPDPGTIHAPSDWKTPQVPGQFVYLPLVFTREE